MTANRLLLTLGLILMIFTAKSQGTLPVKALAQSPSFEIGGRFGYDLPLFNTPYNELKYKGGRNISAVADYHFPSNLGIRLEYANILTRPFIRIPDSVYYAKIAAAVLKKDLPVRRHFIGIGPSYLYRPGGAKFGVLIAPMAGYSWISGGDAYAESHGPESSTLPDVQLINTGFKSSNPAAKVDIEFSYAITDNLSLDLGFYYIRHFGVRFDPAMDITPPGGNPGVIHGENIYDHTVNPYTLTDESPWVIRQDVEKPCCMDLASAGVNMGLKYKLHAPKPPACNICGCPNDSHKVVVTVRDDLSKKVIPNADVAIKDINGLIIATGTTNAFGVVDFGQVPHDNYVVTGIVYDIETTTASIFDEEFLPDAVIRKEVLYTDLRFILKGRTVNKSTRAPEPNVVASLTNRGTGEVKQDNSDGLGQFAFRLEKIQAMK